MTDRYQNPGGARPTVVDMGLPPLAKVWNPSWALSYDGDDNLTQIDATDGTKTYRLTLTYTSGNLTAVSAWSEV